MRILVFYQESLLLSIYVSLKNEGTPDVQKYITRSPEGVDAPPGPKPALVVHVSLFIECMSSFTGWCKEVTFYTTLDHFNHIPLIIKLDRHKLSGKNSNCLQI